MKVAHKYLNLLFSIIIIIINFSLFSPALKYSFVWDDEQLYINEKNYPKNSELKHFSEFWKPKASEMYLPVTKTFWGITASISKNENITAATPYSAKNFHFLNILFHTLNSILVLLLLFKIFKEPIIAFWGAVFFSIHPLQIEPVVWISELRILLCAFFGFSAVLLYFLHNEKKNRLYFIFSLLLLILSMFSKPTGIVFPFIILTIDYFIFKNELKKVFYKFLCLFIIAVPVALLSVYSESGYNGDLATSIISRPFLFGASFAFYLFKLILPFDLAANYGLTPAIVLNHWWAYILVIIPMILLVTTFLIRKKHPEYISSLIIFILGFIPVSGLVTFYYQYWSLVADRYTYISIFGAVLCFGYIIQQIKSQKIRNLFLTAILLIFLVIDYSNIQNWKDDYSLWTNSIQRYPNSGTISYGARGLLLAERGEYDKAMSDYNNAIRLDSNNYTAYYNRGNLKFDMKNFSGAIADFTNCIKINPNFINAFVNRALAFSETNNYKSAIEDFNYAIKINPEQYDLYVNRGIAYGNSNNWDEAIKDFQKALEIEPNAGDAKENLKYAMEQKDKLKNKE